MSEYWPIAQTVDWAADSVHHIQQSEAAGRRCCKTPTRRAGGKYAETKLGSFMIPRFMFWWGNHTRVYGAVSPVPDADTWRVLPHSTRRLLLSSKFLVSLGFTTTTCRPPAPPRHAHTATTHLTHLGFSLYLSCLLTQVALRYRPWPDGHRRWISFLSELESDLMASTRARSNVNELMFFVFFFMIMKKLHDL